MNIAICANNIHGLIKYDLEWALLQIQEILNREQELRDVQGLSWMNYGIELWFCVICRDLNIPYTAYLHTSEAARERSSSIRCRYIQLASKVIYSNRIVKMLERCDIGIAVWNGKQGFTARNIDTLVRLNKKTWIIDLNRKNAVIL